MPTHNTIINLKLDEPVIPMIYLRVDVIYYWLNNLHFHSMIIIWSLLIWCIKYNRIMNILHFHVTISWKSLTRLLLKIEEKRLRCFYPIFCFFQHMMTHGRKKTGKRGSVVFYGFSGILFWRLFQVTDIYLWTKVVWVPN